MAKRSFVGKRELIVIAVAVILTTIGIKASDTLFAPDPEHSDAPCPPMMVFVSSANGGFCIDMYEAAAGEGCSYSEPKNQGETRINLNDPACKPISNPSEKPWRYISQDQASLACAKAGKHLPTNQEWLQSALGTPDRNDDWGEGDCQVNKNWSEQPGLSGSGKDCVSAAGAYDMIGNVWEWVEGAVQDGLYEGRELPATGYIDSLNGEGMPGETSTVMANENYNRDYFWIKESGLRGIVRGGYWDNGANAGQYSVYVVTPPSSAEAGIGFRCAQ